VSRARRLEVRDEYDHSESAVSLGCLRAAETSL
jgi:hypothetical protein